MFNCPVLNLCFHCRHPQDEVVERARSNGKSRRKSSSKKAASPVKEANAAELKRLKRAQVKREAKLLAEAEKTRRAQFAVDEAEAYAAEQEDVTDMSSDEESDGSSVEEEPIPASSLTPRRERIRQRAQSPSADRPYSVHEVDDSAVPSCCNVGLALRFSVLTALLFVALALLLGAVVGEEAFETAGALPAPVGSGALVKATHALAQLNQHTQPTNVMFMATVGGVLGGLYGGLVADV